MLDYGSKIVAGVTPGKGGSTVHGVPVFDTVEETLELKPTASIVFVPAMFAKDAILESIAAGIGLIVVITEHIPVLDTIEILEHARLKNTIILGPNTPGIISVNTCKLGIMPAHIFKQGCVGIISRSGTLTYEIVSSLTNAGIGQTTCIGIGGDPIVGLTFIEALKLMEEDHKTKVIILIGEIGGSLEENAAWFIEKHIKKPVIAYVAGKTAPKGKVMGHAGAIISRNQGTVTSKITALRNANVLVADRLDKVVPLVSSSLY
jgi:succinyl-CoA synthetase alpha subunit